RPVDLRHVVEHRAQQVVLCDVLVEAPDHLGDLLGRVEVAGRRRRVGGRSAHRRPVRSRNSSTVSVKYPRGQPPPALFGSPPRSVRRMTTERASSAEQSGEGEADETGSPPRRVRYWQTPHVERIPAADASFLYMEHPVVHMHVTGVLLLDPSTMPGGYSFERLRDLIVERLHLLRPFRRRVLTVPFGIDHPVWVDDPDFDLDRHLHRTTLP